MLYVGWDNSVDIAARYGKDSPGIETRWERDFSHPPRPTLGPIQRPVQWARVILGGRAAGLWRWPPSPGAWHWPL